MSTPPSRMFVCIGPMTTTVMPQTCTAQRAVTLDELSTACTAHAGGSCLRRDWRMAHAHAHALLERAATYQQNTCRCDGARAAAAHLHTAAAHQVSRPAAPRPSCVLPRARHTRDEVHWSRSAPPMISVQAECAQ